MSMKTLFVNLWTSVENVELIITNFVRPLDRPGEDARQHQWMEDIRKAFPNETWSLTVAYSDQEPDEEYPTIAHIEHMLVRRKKILSEHKLRIATRERTA